MLRDENIICISSIDWDFIWQGHQEIMDVFAKAGNRVLYIENTGIRTPTLKDLPRLKSRLINWKKGVSGFRKEKDNLFVYSPIVLPFPYSKVSKYINRLLFVNNIKRWLAITDFANPIIWTFLPTNVSIDLIDNIDNKKLVVYYCIAEFSELVKSSRKVEKSEEELLKRCDLVFAQGEKIKTRCLKYNKNVHIFPFGVNSEVFTEQKCATLNVPRDMEPIPRPVAGYIGGIHKHLDSSLIKDIASKRPDWSVVLVGPVQINKDTFKDHKNIYLLGKKEHKELPLYVSNFDVCLIPYLLNEYTKTVYPTKLNEYLIMGKPVVSTSMPEIVKFDRENKGLIEIADSPDSFCAKVDEILKRPPGPETKKRRIDIAAMSNWPSRIEKMASFLEAAIKKRRVEKTLRWREEMISFYRRLRGRIFKLALAFILLFILVFKTPLLWFIAAPLKIDEVPVKSDAIVVFGGGVGETGKAGQGYAERARYAIKLYKEDYAPILIFSSGYTYYLNESEEMKNLAISMGAPEASIITEEKASSTYKNVKNVLAILKKRNMRSLILVSSPYHMRRSEIVFNKLREGIRVTYCPIPESEFYGDRKQVRWQHVKAILHEYLGIVYYYTKGYR